MSSTFLTRLQNARQVIQDPTSFAFIWRRAEGPERRYGGVLRYLQNRLYPDYKPPQKRRHERSSRALGERVHRHLAHVVNCAVDGECTCEVKRSVTSQIINKHTRALLTKLHSLHIKPVRCELPIISERWNVGTRIDLVGVKNDGRSVLISIKTGYDRHFNRRRHKDSQLKAPLGDWADTPLSHHRAQLLAEYLICRHEYSVTFDECLIMYAAKQNVTVKRAGKKAASASADDDASNNIHVEMIPNMSRYTSADVYNALAN